jgi:uncharacterized protein (DUF305 family)
MALLVAVVTASCARSHVQTSPQPGAPNASEQAAIAQARADSIRHPYTQADVQFMQGMIHHHAQAIVMSRWAPTHGASPPILTLTSRIINAQQDEITLMQRWLRDRRQTVPDPLGTSMTMPMGDAQHPMLMPGMLTPEQMKELDAARGPEFDRLFLTDMIQHHEGAISMVKALFDSYGAAQDELVFKFASDVNVDQTTEVARMRRMLFVFSLGRSTQ